MAELLRNDDDDTNGNDESSNSEFLPEGIDDESSSDDTAALIDKAKQQGGVDESDDQVSDAAAASTGSSSRRPQKVRRSGRKGSPPRQHWSTPGLSAWEGAQSVLCPEFSDSIAEQLQARDPRPCLLNLAQMFREQSNLLLRQARHLEELAIEESLPDSREDLDEFLRQENTIFLAGKAQQAMLDCHSKMDFVEANVLPWSQAPLGVEKKVYGPSGYAVYLKKRFADFAKELGTNKVCEVMKVLSKVWKDLSDEERRPYMDEAAAIRAAKRAEGELLRTMLKRKQR